MDFQGDVYEESLHQTLHQMQCQMHALTDDNLRLKRKLMRLSKQAARARHLAYHDALTGLPNRSLLWNRMKQAHQQAVRDKKQVALLFLDLDDFKFVNDRFGHAAGDHLLKQVAKRLTSSIRGGDTACRYGGDEFIVMLPSVVDEHSVFAAANKLRELLTPPYSIGDRLIAVNVSIGLALCGAQDNYEELIKQADLAMYNAKARNHDSNSSAISDESALSPC
ncbi:MAG: GGDEF domain-containing protein [Candidatus Obscuribacterales bacterium]|nr:GGDEF domain-containing protein [Steroidobacteraceae bacterium]